MNHETPNSTHKQSLKATQIPSVPLQLDSTPIMPGALEIGQM